MTATPAAAARKPPRDFQDRIQVFAPHRASLPPMGPYLREFWRRRRFAYELSRTTQKADHTDTVLGAVWVVLNPMLLGVVYFLLVAVLGGAKGSWVANLGRILVGLFTWFFAANSMGLGAQSVTSGGRLILNQAFPPRSSRWFRLNLPICWLARSPFKMYSRVRSRITRARSLSRRVKRSPLKTCLALTRLRSVP